MNTPKIRFKGFKDDWEQRKLSEICERITRKNRNNESDLPLTIASQFGLIDQRDFFNKVVAAKDMSNYYLLKKGEFAYNKSYSNGFDYGSIKRLNAYKQGCLSTLYICFGITSDEVESDYLECFFDTLKWYGDLSMICAEGARNHGLLNVDTKGFFDEVTVDLPKSLEEQKRISVYMNALNRLITLHQRKCDETKQLKKFMLQKMFPKNGEKNPEIRFEGFTDDWEQRKLGELGKATGGTSIESEFSAEGVYKVISIGSYSENSVYNDQGIRAIKSDKTNNRVLNRNDLTMILNDKTTSGNIIGRVLLIEESGIYVYNQRTERIEINVEEYDPVFLYEMLNAPNIREKIIKQSQGNTQIYVNWSAISLLDYMIPSKEEQVKIGEYLHNISHLITLHQRKCEKLKELKKFMLQNMFV
ncbi:restriction endonuclease subunit S [Clostridium sp. AM42-36]|nr:restriction endonuclease subunit S [Clostridium sp. AM42-36]